MINKMKSRSKIQKDNGLKLQKDKRKIKKIVKKLKSKNEH
jgi:hypothetical protein